MIDAVDAAVIPSGEDTLLMTGLRLTEPVLHGHIGRVIVLIPAHNEVSQLGVTINAVKMQSCVPDDIIILIDNAKDPAMALRLAEIAWAHGVTAIQTVKNRHRKAGNLNTALKLLLPRLRSNDVIMGFDADSVPDRLFVEKAARWLEQGYGSVGATFHGRPGGGLLGLLQRAEFARFARHQDRSPKAEVLSGTGWATRVGAMRRVMRARREWVVYDTQSLVEDFELTLAFKRAGIPVIAPANCLVLTDVMETIRDWASQRLRWQHGTLRELSRYGWGHETRKAIVKQVVTYLGMIALPLTVVYLTWSFLLFGWQGINPLNAKLYLGCIAAIVIEQAWQARKAGPLAVIGTILIVPELLYSVGRQLVYLRALYKLARRRQSHWGAGTSV